MAAAGAVGGGNLLFHVVATHALTGADYASLAAVLGVLLVGLVPVGALQAASTRAAAADPAAPSAEALARAARLGLGVVLGGIAVAGLLGSAIAVDDPLVLAQLGGWLALALFGAVARGVVLGRHGYRAAATSVLAGTAARLGFGALLIAPMGVLGAMVATVLGEGVASLLAVRAVLGAPCEHGATSRPPLRIGGLDAGLALAGQLGTWTFVAALPVLGRRVLPGSAAGDLAVVATTAGGAFVLALTVGTAHFPRLAAGADGALGRALRSAAGLGGAAGLGFLLAGEAAAGVVAGRAVDVDGATVSALALVPPLLGVIGVLTGWLVARRRPSALVSWLPTTALVVGVWVGRPDQAATIAVLAAASAGVGALGLAAATARDLRRSADPADPLPLPPAGPGTIDLSVVVPTKDGGGSLRPAVEELLAALERRPTGSSEVIVVVDGSTDGSEATLRGLPIRIVSLPRNQGKGAALRHGFAAAEGRLVGFIDGDGDLGPAALLAMEAALVADPEAWAAVGDRHHPESAVDQRAARRALSRLHRRLVRTLFGMDVRDTQCGVKVFRRQALGEVLASCVERGFALDVELLAVAAGRGLGRVHPVPVQLHRPAGATSSVGLRAVVGLAAATVGVRLRLRALPAAGPAAPPGGWAEPTRLATSGPVAAGR